MDAGVGKGAGCFFKTLIMFIGVSLIIIVATFVKGITNSQTSAVVVQQSSQAADAGPLILVLLATAGLVVVIIAVRNAAVTAADYVRSIPGITIFFLALLVIGGALLVNAIDQASRTPLEMQTQIVANTAVALSWHNTLLSALTVGGWILLAVVVVIMASKPFRS